MFVKKNIFFQQNGIHGMCLRFIKRHETEVSQYTDAIESVFGVKFRVGQMVYHGHIEGELRKAKKNISQQKFKEGYDCAMARNKGKSSTSSSSSNGSVFDGNVQTLPASSVHKVATKKKDVPTETVYMPVNKLSPVVPQKSKKNELNSDLPWGDNDEWFRRHSSQAMSGLDDEQYMAEHEAIM